MCSDGAPPVVMLCFCFFLSSSAVSGRPRADQCHLVILLTCCALPNHLISIYALLLPLANASSLAYFL